MPLAVRPESPGPELNSTKKIPLRDKVCPRESPENTPENSEISHDFPDDFLDIPTKPDETEMPGNSPNRPDSPDGDRLVIDMDQEPVIMSVGSCDETEIKRPTEPIIDISSRDDEKSDEDDDKPIVQLLTGGDAKKPAPVICPPIMANSRTVREIGNQSSNSRLTNRPGANGSNVRPNGRSISQTTYLNPHRKRYI